MPRLAALAIAVAVAALAPAVARANDGDPATVEATVPGLTAAEARSAIERQEASEAAEYARERGIATSDARRRLAWARRASDLQQRGRRLVGERFGGVWIDRADGRVKLGLTDRGTDAVSAASAAIAASGLGDGTDVVAVRRSEEELHAVLDWLAAELKPTYAETRSGVAYGLATDKNAVVIEVPRSGDGLTESQRRVVNAAVERFGDAVRVELYDGRAQEMACSQAPLSWGGYPFPFCHPPLRAGISYDPNSTPPRPSCTGAFIVRGRGVNQYTMQLTAGHCLSGYSNYAPPYNQVGTKFVYNGARHVIGPVQNWYDGYWGDAGAVRVSNVSGWGPLPFVFVTPSSEIAREEEYKILTKAEAPVGGRVCSARAASGSTDCGYVTQVGFVDPEGAHGLTKTSFCLRSGDSGGPVFAYGAALGINRGTYGTWSPCQSWYVRINPALELTNSNLVVWPW